MKGVRFRPSGVIPAVLLPFKADGSIDAAAFRRHLADVCVTEGLSAITVNAHSTEVHACDFEEQREVVEIAVDEVGGRIPVVCGIYSDGTRQAQRLARMAEVAGASALLVFPPHTIGSLDGQDRPEMALAHFKAIAEASSLPIILFQYQGSYAYPLPTLLELFDKVPSICAIKDWSPPIEHERNIRMFQGLSRPVGVLSTNSAWLMSSLAMGANGLLSGSGSVIAGLQVDLFKAVKANNLSLAKSINDRIYPTARQFYARPWVDMHNRMKEALVILGRLQNATVRAPLVAITQEERHAIRRALGEAGLLERAAA
jgi:4-hydroxy-tetrahydrodipicolinate synthase